ncbi:MAG: GrpB family protein [Pseudomonadota bacterium]
MARLLLPHSPTWGVAFAAEAKALSDVLCDLFLVCHHVGSTAVPGILSKPIIDILGVLPDLTGIDAKSPVLEALGYQVMGEHGIPGRRYFRKTNSDGARTHHLHVYAAGSHHVERHLAFRDYLRAHPAKAAAYSALKARIVSDPAVSSYGYQDAKASFVRRVEGDALAWMRRTRTA